MHVGTESKWRFGAQTQVQYAMGQQAQDQRSNNQSALDGRGADSNGAWSPTKMAIVAMGQCAQINKQWRKYAGRVVQSARGNRPNNIVDSIRRAAKGQSVVEDQKTR